MGMSITAIEWTTDAACRGAYRDAFFPPNATERKDDRLERESVDKRICAGCAVREDCLEMALRNHEIHGIWGGLNEDERRSLIRAS